jgi:hypothetical protein
MSDVIYKLPDGSIKSFPDSMSEKEIKRFVTKIFPIGETADWLTGALSRHIQYEPYDEERPSLGARFDSYTSPEIASQHDVARPYARGTNAGRGTDRVAMGSISEEKSSEEDRKLIGGGEWKREPTIRRVIEDVINGVPAGPYGTIPHDIFIDYRPGFFPRYALVDAVRQNGPGQYLSGFAYPRRGFYPVVGEPTYSGEKYSAGNGARTGDSMRHPNVWEMFAGPLVRASITPQRDQLAAKRKVLGHSAARRCNSSIRPTRSRPMPV